MPGGSDDFLPLLLLYLPQVPQVLAWLTGMILAFVFWSRYPRVCFLSFIAILLLFLQKGLGMLRLNWLVEIVGHDRESLERWLYMLQITYEFMGTVAWVLILFAIFGWRKPPRATVPIADSLPRTPVGDLPRKNFPASAIRE